MADSEQLLITLGVQDKGTTKQISALNKEIKALDKEFKSAKSVSKDFEKSQDGLKSKLGYLEKSYAANNTKLEAYKKKMKETKEAIAKKQSELEKLNSAEEVNEKAVNKATEQLEKMKATLHGTEQNITLTENEMKKLSNQIKETNSTLESHALDQYKQKMQDLGSGIQNAGDKMQKTGQVFSATGASLLKLSAPVVAFSAYAIKVGTDFEYAMKKVQATSGATQQELNVLTEKAKEMGATTKWSASDAADGLNYMAMAGWKTEQMVAGLEPIMNLATAAGTDLALTSDIVTDALTAFGLKAEDTGHFTDIIASASSNANTNVEMLGESFQYCAPVCGALGFTAEDTAIALGLMANAGIKGSSSGTALRSALTNLAKPTEKMSKFMDRYGISLTDADGKMKTLKEVMDSMREKMGKLTEEEKKQAMTLLESSASAELAGNAMKDLTEEEQSQIIASKLGEEALKGMTSAQIDSALSTTFSKKELKGMTEEQKKYQLACRLGSDQLEGLSEAEQARTASAIFGKEAMSGLLAIVNASESDYNKLSGAIYNCNGKTKEMADIMANSTQGKIDSFKSKLEALGIQVADDLLPHMNDLIDEGMKLIDWFSSLDSSTQSAIINFGLITFASGGLLSAVGKVTTNVGGLVTWVGKLTSASGTSATTVGKLGGTLGNLTKIATPLGIAIAGISSAVYLYNKEQDALNNTVITAREDMGFLESALLSLNGVQVKNRKELEDSGLVYKKFGEDIGNEFKSKVEDATKSINDFNFYLKEINLDQAITEEESKGFTDKINKICENSIQAIKDKQVQSQQEIKSLFTISDGTVDESEQKVLDFLNKNYEISTTEIQNIQNEINEIYKKGIEERGYLNEDEIKQIQEKNSRIKQIELEALANNEQEQLYAKNEFIERIKKVDAEGAKELLVEKKKQLDEQSSQQIAAYNTGIDQMKAAVKQANDELANTTDEGRKQELQANIDNMNSQIETKIQERDGVIQKQRETLQGCIDVVNEMNPELKGLINQYTCEILSDADLQAQKGLDYARQHYDGLEAVTHDGWYKVKDVTTGAMEDCYVTVDKNSGQITGCWNQTKNIVGGYTEEFKNKVKELGEQHEIDRLKIQQAMGEISQSHLDSKNQVVSSNGEVIGSLQQVTEAENGVKTGILDVNGTPIQIETNADGTITKMGEVKDSIDRIPPEKKFTFKAFFEKVGDWFGSIGEKATGTYNYSGGLSTVDENSKWELASNNNVRMLGSYNSNPLAYIPNGTGIRTHMQSISDMKAEVSKQINSLMLSGGYYNRDTLKSKQLIKTSNINNYSNGAEIDYNKLADVMLNVIQQGLSNINTIVNVDVDANGIVNRSVDKTLDKLNRQNRISRVAKGR
ncbi:phage tail tape measure protein [Clostridium botulinum]|uniref:phage tail tape measure protein n=1 Tax=Clostridium botulinum TaxID=1491 RepID=UPI001967A1B0|nr:phage tail tape measure protein [Clostridium botulinum]MBN1043736.1 phage tail tape measure protein [Clostridium botulinum]